MSFTEGDPDSRHFLHVVPATETEGERDHLGFDTSASWIGTELQHLMPAIQGHSSMETTLPTLQKNRYHRCTGIGKNGTNRGYHGEELCEITRNRSTYIFTG